MTDVNAILDTLRSELGKPYVWGASGPNSFDCSGLVQYVYGRAGIQLPRTAEQQTHSGTSVPKGQQQPGDLVFSDWGDGPSSHVAVYIGGNQIIEAPEPGKNVEITTLGPSYLARVSNIQRVTGLTGTVTGSAGADFNGSGTAGFTSSDPFSGIVDSITKSIGAPFQDIAQTFSILDKLSLPATWVRVGAGVFGLAAVTFGVVFLAREVKG